MNTYSVRRIGCDGITTMHDWFGAYNMVRFRSRLHLGGQSAAAHSHSCRERVPDEISTPTVLPGEPQHRLCCIDLAQICTD